MMKRLLKFLFWRSYLVNYEFSGGAGRAFISSKGRVTQRKIMDWERLIRSGNPLLVDVHVKHFQRIKGGVFK